jgi:hypothetical protein
MAVFRDVLIPFGGREYTVTPSVKLLRMIEMKGRRDNTGFNLVEVFVRLSAGSGYYDGAFVLAELINASGGKVTDDEALAQFQSFAGPKELTEYINLVCSCIMPDVAGKKPEAEAAAA